VWLDVEFFGAGAAVLKAPELLFVSVQPLLARKFAVVFVNVGAALLPSKHVALPKPRKSKIADRFAVGHVPPLSGEVPLALPVRVVVLVTRAILAPLTARLGAELLASGVGRETPHGAFPQETVFVAASCTR